MQKNIPLVVLAALWLLPIHLLCNVAHARGAAGGAADPEAWRFPLPESPTLQHPDTTLHAKDTLQIEEVEINTGFQRIPRERATGSFVFIDSALLHRSFSSDVLSRLEGVVPGLRFNRDRNNPDAVDMTLRGPSTIRANNQPLIILDNFEYQGDLNNINPNDIANITVLKDAAAASIWGAKAGNGMIVISTKSGRLNQRTQLSFSSHLSSKDKQNLHATPALHSTDFIDLEIDLFARGYYNGVLSDINKRAVSPVVWLLAQQRSQQLDEAAVSSAIAELRHIDTRDDLSRYLQQRSLTQQHALSLSGGGAANRYYASVGYDRTRQQVVGNRNERLSLLFNNSIGLLDNRLEFRTGLGYTLSRQWENGIDPVPGLTYPYGRLMDAQGNTLPVAQYNPGFIDTVGRGRLLDWQYRPLDELALLDNSTQLADVQLNLQVDYKPRPWLRASGLYQYANGHRANSNYQPEASYYTRDLINQFSAFAPNGEILRPVPLGGILDQSNSRYHSQRARLQLDAQHTWHAHEFQALAGAEASDRHTRGDGARYYGYDKQVPNSVPVDAANPYMSMVTGRQTLRISNTRNLQHLTDRFISLYANASYGYAKTYWLTGSIRRDGSNLFGVRTNQQWNPLWSVGAKWIIDREPFYGLNWLPALAARLTYGTSGNIDRTVTAYLVGRTASTNKYGQSVMTLLTPPNPDLTWETVTTFNAALDFSLLPNKRISGSVEYFRKHARDLMSPAEISAATGLLTYVGNTANTTGHGVDISLRSNNTRGALQWQTTLLYSYTHHRVSEYRLSPGNNSSYINNTPMVDKPLDAIFRYRWAGLDPTNGNPRGYLNGEVSDNYALMFSSTDHADIRYIGPRQATHFGSLRNDFSWRQLSLSFQLLFKGGHYFTRNMLSYGQLYSGSYFGGAHEFVERWQQPGDENRTNVPAMVYPVNSGRDAFYAGSELAAERADFLRLQDLRLGYQLRHLNVYLLANNPGLLWKATTLDYDPDYGFINRQTNWTLGLTINF